MLAASRTFGFHTPARMLPMWRALFFVALGFAASHADAQNGQPETRPPKTADPLPPATRSPAASRPARAHATSRLAATQRLMLRLERIDFDDIPLASVFAQLARLSGANIVVRWSRLGDAGIARDQPITLHASRLRLRQCLQLVLQQASARTAPLAYLADEDLILVSTAEDFDRQMVTRVYDVKDLIMPRLRESGFAQFRGRQIPIGAIPTVANGAVAYRPITAPFGSGVYIGGAPPEEFRPDRDAADGTKEQHLRQLITVITGTIEPQSWAVNGGTGTIVPFRGQLIIRNSVAVHAQIAGRRTPPGHHVP